MEKSILIGGFGGQGVQTLGKLLAYSANEDEKEVTFSPAYGGEMRGGTSNCTVVISDDEITSPNKKLLDVIVVMNNESLKAFEKRLKKGGLLIINDSLVKAEPTRDDINVIKASFNDVANRIGNDKVLNVVTMGFIVEYTNVVTMDSAKRMLVDKLGKKEAFRKVNDEAFLAGIAIAKEKK